MDKDLAEILWDARWAAKNNKSELAVESITKALVHIGAEKPKVVGEVVDRPTEPMPEKYLKGIVEPEFVIVKGVKYPARGAYRTASGKFAGLVVHYTVSGRKASNARGVVHYLASRGFGCMVMDEDGKIYIPEGFDILRHWGEHAGISKWGNRVSVSDEFAGMEICCWGRNSKEGPFREFKKGEANIIPGKYQQFTLAQERSLINFIMWARTVNDEFDLDNVVGHDEIREAAGKKGDKQDPGGSLSWTMPEFRKLLKETEK